MAMVQLAVFGRLGGNFGQMRPKKYKARPKLATVGQQLVKFGRTWPKYGPIRPSLVQHGQSWSRFGQDWPIPLDQTNQVWSTLAKCGTNPQFGPHLGSWRNCDRVSGNFAACRNRRGSLAETHGEQPCGNIRVTRASLPSSCVPVGGGQIKRIGSNTRRRGWPEGGRQEASWPAATPLVGPPVTSLSHVVFSPGTDQPGHSHLRERRNAAKCCPLLKQPNL